MYLCNVFLFFFFRRGHIEKLTKTAITHTHIHTHKRGGKKLFLRCRVADTQLTRNRTTHQLISRCLLAVLSMKKGREINMRAEVQRERERERMLVCACWGKSICLDKRHGTRKVGEPDQRAPLLSRRTGTHVHNRLLERESEEQKKKKEGKKKKEEELDGFSERCRQCKADFKKKKVFPSTQVYTYTP